MYIYCLKDPQEERFIIIIPRKPIPAINSDSVFLKGNIAIKSCHGDPMHLLWHTEQHLNI